MKNKENGRESGIELLKMLSVILIVISHTTYTFFQENSLFSNEYIIPLNHATRNIQYWILTWMSFWGQQGNLLFFVASAWFLVDKDEVNIRKCIKLILDSQVISVIFLFVIGRFITLSPLEIIINIFPTRWELYWYIPFYIMFYLIHGHINRVIKNLSQKGLLIFCVSMLLLYFGLNYLHKGYFFFSNMTIFITVYLVISYMKKYMISFYANRSVNKICAILGIGITPILIVITNYLGLYFSFFEDKVRMWGGAQFAFYVVDSNSFI